MRIKVYRAATVALAMAEIRDALGLDALILSTTSRDGGVEVTAALEIEDEPTLSPFLSVPDMLAADAPTDGGPGSRTLPDRTPADPWARHNLPRELAAALRQEPAERVCARWFRFGALPIAGGQPPTMLVGPPGVGKTLTVAKLATRLVLSGQHPLVITADDRRAGAVEQLAGFTRLLGLTLIAAGRPDSLGRALERRDGDAPVLIDAPGLDLQDPAHLDLMNDLLTVSDARPVLVLAAGSDPLETAEIAADHARLGARHLLATRLDRAGRLGGILAAAKAGDLMLTEAGTSASVADALERFSPAGLAHRLCPDRPLETSAAPDAMPRVIGGQAGPPGTLALHIAAQAGAARAAKRPIFGKMLP